MDKKEFSKLPEKWKRWEWKKVGAGQLKGEYVLQLKGTKIRILFKDGWLKMYENSQHWISTGFSTGNLAMYKRLAEDTAKQKGLI